jgi:hypothetical protein
MSGSGSSVIDRQVCAIHEAGHCTCAFLLRATRGAGPVTVQGCGGFAGIAFTGRAERPTNADTLTLVRPYPLVAARLRRRYESEAMTLLAGEIATDLWVVRGDAEPLLEVPEADEETCSVNEFPLPEREERLLEEAAASSPRFDLGRALDILTGLHFSHDLAARHAAFLQGECEVMMRDPLAGRMVRALAGELLIHGTLSARRWIAILRAVR